MGLNELITEINFVELDVVAESVCTQLHIHYYQQVPLLAVAVVIHHCWCIVDVVAVVAFGCMLMMMKTGEPT